MNPGYNIGDRKAMHARLRTLTGRWLLTQEASELETLAETLAVPIRWKRFRFQDNKQIALGQPTATQKGLLA